MSEAFYNYLLELLGENQVLKNEPMSKHTTFKTGGNASVFVKIETKEQLVKLLRYLQIVERDYFILGNGSNLLVSDKGYDGVIIQIGSLMSDAYVKGDRIYAKAGASLAMVARLAAGAGLTGMEFASGIPGTIGEAFRMNAGAYDSDMSQVVESVSVIDLQGEEMTLDNATMEFGYRRSAIVKTNHIVTEVVLKLTPDDEKEILAKMDDLNQRRRDKQPLEFPSAGSTFKRTEGHFAGKLIMDAGLKGYQIGGAAVSEKHCGFIINKGNATSTDVYRLIQYVKERVKEAYNVSLEPEVILLGEFPKD